MTNASLYQSQILFPDTPVRVVGLPGAPLGWVERIRKTSKNPMSVRLLDGQTVAVSRSHVQTDLTEAEAAEVKEALMGSLEQAIKFTLGTIVRIDSGKFAGVYVCLGLPAASGKVRIAKIGGDGGRYVTAHMSGLTVLNPSEVLR